MMRPRKLLVVPPVESALPGVVAKELDADRGKRLPDVSFGGGLNGRIDGAPVRVDPPGTEQRVKGNGNDGWAIASANPVITALPQNRRERPLVVKQTVPKFDADCVDLRYRSRLVPANLSQV
jgi:hypothetical protein